MSEPDSIISYIRREFNLVIGKKTAKALKEELGSGLPGRQETMTVVGLDVVSGLPVEREITAEVVYGYNRPSHRGNPMLSQGHSHPWTASSQHKL